MPHEVPSKAMPDCMEECGQCAGMCLQCVYHCLSMGGEHASPEHQGIMRDCAEICSAAFTFMARRSPHAVHICKECVEICNECAESCDTLAKGDAMMKQCAELCRKCAKACEKMAGAAV